MNLDHVKGLQPEVKRMRLIKLACPVVLISILFVLGWSNRAEAFAVYPFYSRHMSPVTQIFGLPPAEGGTLTPSGHLEGRVVLDIANNFNKGKNPNETLNFDGETYRTTLALRYGLNKTLEIGLDVPYVAHTGGVFDGFIEGFHNVFHFTNKSRNEVKNNQLDYQYIRNGVTRIDIENSTSGLGDLMMSLGVRLYRDDAPKGRSAALRLGLKLPTGDSDRLLGSGSTDFSLALAGTDPASLSAWDLTLFGEIGGVWINNSEVLEDMTRHLVGFGTLGFGWAPLTWMALKAQLDVHSPFFRDTRINALGPWATQVDVGFTFALAKKTFFDLGISEPILVETAPDVDFHLALRRRF